jgi:hypothetical protein
VTGVWTVASLQPGKSTSISFEVDDSDAEWNSMVVVKAHSSFSPHLDALAFVQKE